MILIYGCCLQLYDTSVGTRHRPLYFDISMLTLRVSPQRIGLGQLISPPTPMMPPAIGKLETIRRTLLDMGFHSHSARPLHLMVVRLVRVIGDFPWFMFDRCKEMINHFAEALGLSRCTL
jgi:hypothetical protein